MAYNGKKKLAPKKKVASKKKKSAVSKSRSGNIVTKKKY